MYNVFMAELLSTILQSTESVVELLNDSKDASKDCSKLLKEISSVYDLLFDLKDLVSKAESGDAVLLAVTECAASNSPLAEFKLVLEHLATHLEPAVGLKKNQKVLARPFNREKLRDIFRSIDRLKKVYHPSLQKDHM